MMVCTTRHQVWSILLTGLVCCLQTGTAGAAVTLDEVGRGELLLRTDQPGRFQPALQLLTRADMKISGMVAEVTVTQSFRNPGLDWSEGLYVFPLPETAAVNRMQIRIGERIIIGEIRKKEVARSLFKKARNEGKKAALMEQHRPNLFVTAIANLSPGEELTVQITYWQKVRYDNGTFSLRFPMAITPRYPDRLPAAGDRLHVDDNSTGRAGPIELSINLEPGVPLAAISSAHHDIQVVRQGDAYSIDLPQTRMDRDFVLKWEPTAAQAPRTALFTEQSGGETYALLMILPPDRQGQALPLSYGLPRAVVFVIDTSGSMGGKPIRQARAALQLAIQSLTPEDRFNVIQFNSTTDALFHSARTATQDNRNAALKYIAGLTSGGGTEMLPAILYALRQDAQQTDQMLRQVVFVTDGAVSYEQDLFRVIGQQLGNSRLFTVGIGSAPNSYFMRKAARFGRGTFTYIGKPEEIREKMDSLFRRLRYPVSRNITLTWPRGIVPEGYPAVIPDLYFGEPLVMTIRLRRSRGQLQVSGEGPEGEWQQMLSLDDRQNGVGITSLWARDKIASLDDEIALTGETELLRDSITALALKHRLASRYTSFLAVEQEPSRPADFALNSSHIANSRPAGQATQVLSYPQTATTAIQKLWLGSAGFFLALLIGAWTRRTTAYGSS